MTFLQWKHVVFLRGLHDIIGLKVDISLKDLELNTCRRHALDFEIKRGKLSLIHTLAHIFQNDTN
jgi:hypothetical protein